MATLDEQVELPDPTSLVELGAEAALELDELKEGVRTDVPALAILFEHLTKPSSPLPSGGGVSMLSDLRSRDIFKSSINKDRLQPGLSREEFAKMLEDYFQEIQNAVNRGERDRIDEAKRFCLRFSNALISQDIKEMYERRDQINLRYMDDELI